MGCVVVAEAGCAQQGLEHFQALRPRLVTLDLMMPDDPSFTSKELFRKIREEAPETAVFMISVQRTGINAPGFLAEGAAAYFEKSFINFDQMKKKLLQIFPELGSGPAPRTLSDRLRKP